MHRAREEYRRGHSGHWSIYPGPIPENVHRYPTNRNEARAGVAEAKPARDDAWLTADGKQVTKYWGQYGQVLVTNYRDFLLVGRDMEDGQVKLESSRLAANEAEFWRAVE